MSDTLWTDERIERLASDCTDELDGDAGVYHLFCVAIGMVRADYEARIAELEAQLAAERERMAHYYQETAQIVAAASRWEPLPDGMEPIEIEISHWIEEAGDDATSYHKAAFAYDSITIDQDCISWGAHDNIRLCRRTGEATNEN